MYFIPLLIQCMYQFTRVTKVVSPVNVNWFERAYNKQNMNTNITFVYLLLVAI